VSRQFSGLNSMTAGNGTFLQGLAGLGIGAWVYRTAAGTKNWAFVCRTGTGYSPLHSICLYWYSNNSIYFDMSNGSVIGASTPANTATGWHYLFANFISTNANGSRLQIYFDGVLQSLTAAGTQPTVTSSNLSGATVYFGDYKASGEINNSGSRLANVQLFDTYLSRALIKDSMHTPFKTAALPVCLSSWRFATDGSVEPDECGRQAATPGSVAYSPTLPPTWIP